LPLIDQVSHWPIVLVVDDDAEFCDNLWETLRSHEYRVDIANSESEGIVKAKQTVFQTAIVDLRLNHGDGRHVIEIAHRLRPDAKLLVVTGQRDEINSLPEGVKGLCYKPVDMDELLRLIQ
jgi:ActR/RegA family two-component response regulator